MLLTKEVEIIPSGKSIKYYTDKGYSVEWRNPLMVKVEDLPRYSKVQVSVLCDYCRKEIIQKPYSEYLRNKDFISKDACKNCKTEKSRDTIQKKYNVDELIQIDGVIEKMQNTCLEKYGQKNPFSIKEFQEKSKNTMIEKYGIEKPLQSLYFKDKQKETYNLHYGDKESENFYDLLDRRKNTCIDRYGADNPMHVVEFQEKKNDTCLNKYGVINPSTLAEVKTKARETCLLKYGGESPLSSRIIREKSAKTFYENNIVNTSKQQMYLCHLYNGEPNYPIKWYNSDIYLEDYNMDIEYDGGGHNLKVKIGQMTKEEFNQNEIIRNNVIKKAGYKQMRIISTKDLLPSDEILLQMLEHTRKYFSDYPNHSWITFNIDTSTVHNAEQRDGVFFNYCELRRIKKSDLQNEENDEENYA